MKVSVLGMGAFGIALSKIIKKDIKISIWTNFEDELKKFKPSLEIEDAEDVIYRQDLDDMSDVIVKLLKDASKEAETQKRGR